MEDKNGKATACNKTTKHLQTRTNIDTKACGSAINKKQKPYHRGGFVAAEAFEALLQEAPCQERFFITKHAVFGKHSCRRAESMVGDVLKGWSANAMSEYSSWHEEIPLMP